jgi:Fic family protein
MAKCSTDTALRDISDLVEKGVLTKGGAGGRSAYYEIAFKTSGQL